MILGDGFKPDTEEQEPFFAAELLRSLMEEAVRSRASDIHFEPVREGVRIRFRLDGRLKEVMRCDNQCYPTLVARLKVLSGMDISEKRKPQDGRYTFVSEQIEADVRVSSIPTVAGEKMVLRFFYQEVWNRDKEELGLCGEELLRLEQILARPHGLVLVTGPTGSGKTTTLYTVLQEMDREEVSLVTIEEPVEVRLDGISQIPVNTRAGLTFALALRSLLRQDPDIIMVGEIRDRETAEIAVQASITGRLVLSTLHTESASSAVVRMLDLGVEPYLLADSLVGVAAQRLVRRLCSCRVRREMTEKERVMLGIKGSEAHFLWEPCGCEKCHETGYDGRTGVFEVMEVTASVRRAIREGRPSSVIRELAIKEGMKTLRENTAAMVLNGVTSFDQYVRLTDGEVENEHVFDKE